MDEFKQKDLVDELWSNVTPSQEEIEDRRKMEQQLHEEQLKKEMELRDKVDATLIDEDDNSGDAQLEADKLDAEFNQEPVADQGKGEEY